MLEIPTGLPDLLLVAALSGYIRHVSMRLIKRHQALDAAVQASIERQIKLGAEQARVAKALARMTRALPSPDSADAEPKDETSGKT